MRNDTQYAHILYHTVSIGGLTATEAVKEYGIGCLHKRVGELESKGYKFDRIWEDGENRYGHKTRYKRYYLVERPEETKCQ